jgi:hypothetical protein
MRFPLDLTGCGIASGDYCFLTMQKIDGLLRGQEKNFCRSPQGRVFFQREGLTLFRVKPRREKLFS